MKRRAWTRDELILAVNLYCKTSFGRIHQGTPDIIKLSSLINRTPSAVAWKMCNFASIDPSLDRKGASNVGKMDIQIWNEFFNNWEQLAFESEKLLAKLHGEGTLLQEDIDDSREGQDKERFVKTRVNQAFFRKMVLSSYDFKCCMTALSIPELLVGSHIIPWAKDKKNRLNPRNGLCLNSLHDKAFDQGLISVSDDFKIMVSDFLRDKYKGAPEKKFLLDYSGFGINMPKRFLPDKDFLDYHRNNVFIR